MPTPKLATLLLFATALAALTLLLPLEPVFDPWAWLVWGREGLGLDTSGGPSWKPLPVLVAWPLSAAGDLAPELWLLIARAGGLAAVALAALLAARIAQRTGTGRGATLVAAGLAALGVAAFDDPLTPWTRQLAGGLAEPLLLALTLAAVELHLRGRSRAALLAGTAGALIRPEAWAPLAVYGFWLWRREPPLRRWVAGCGAAIAILWFLPDLLASGSALTGASRAAAPDGGLSRLPGAAFEGLRLAPWTMLAGAAWLARPNGADREVSVLAAGALLWFGATLAFTLFGFAGLSRFFVPFAGVVCVLGAVGIVDLTRRALAAGRRPVLAAMAILALAVGAELGLRLAQVPADYRSAVDYSRSVEQVRGLVERTGAERLLACGPLATSDVLTQAPLTWELEVSLARVDVVTRRPPRAGIVLLGSGAPPVVRRPLEGGPRPPLAVSGEFSAYEISCSARASSLSGRAIPGVWGADR